MSNIGNLYPATSSRRLLAERLAGMGPPLHQVLLEIIATIGDWQHITLSLIYADVPPRPIELSEPALSAYVSEVEQARAHGIPKIFRLANDLQAPSFALYYDVESDPVGDVEYIWFSLPSTEIEGLLQIGKVVSLVANTSLGFGSYNSHVEDEPLLLLYRGARGAERARAVVSPELRRFVPTAHVPENAIGSLPELLVPQEFNRRYVPDAVWWVNFWDKRQVETVGRDRIQTAGWARVIEQPDEALVLVATDEPIDVSNAAHLEQLRRIIGHLKLRELQERYRY